MSLEITPLLLTKFWLHVKKTNNCWEWIGGHSSYGYGRFHWKKKYYLSHRIAYEIIRKNIPQGLELTHLCKNKNCCNPKHLKAVTQREIVLRGNCATAINARKTHCPQGHEYSGTIKNGGRICRICRNKTQRKYEWRVKHLRS